MLGRFLRRQKPRIASVGELTLFLERNAWLVAQKSIIGYCQVKALMPIHEMMKDKPFADAYQIAIWAAYPAALADLVVIAETYLRTDVGQAGASALADIYEAQLAAHPPPAHLANSWGPAGAAVRARLAIAAARPPLSIRQISETAAQAIYDSLPIHARLRAPDKPGIEAGVQFLMVGLAHEFERIDWSAIGAEVAGRS
jgi:hypothetical protein